MANDNEIKDAAVNPGQDNGQDAGAPAASEGPKGRRREVKEQAPNLNLVELKDMSIQKLNVIAKEFGLVQTAGLRKQELIFKILQSQATP